jgi:hypothetical protein
VRFKPETKTLRDGGCTSNAMISGVVDLTQQPHVPLSSMTLCRRSLCALPRIRPRTTSSGQIEEPPLSSLVIVSLHQLEACGNTSPASVPKFTFPSRTLYQSSYLPRYSLAGFSPTHSTPSVRSKRTRRPVFHGDSPSSSDRYRKSVSDSD